MENTPIMQLKNVTKIFGGKKNPHDRPERYVLVAECEYTQHRHHRW